MLAARTAQGRGAARGMVVRPCYRKCCADLRFSSPFGVRRALPCAGCLRYMKRIGVPGLARLTSHRRQADPGCQFLMTLIGRLGQSFAGNITVISICWTNPATMPPSACARPTRRQLTTSGFGPRWQRESRRPTTPLPNGFRMRMPTRVGPNRVKARQIEIIRLLHSSQQWP